MESSCRTKPIRSMKPVTKLVNAYSPLTPTVQPLQILLTDRMSTPWSCTASARQLCLAARDCRYARNDNFPTCVGHDLLATRPSGPAAPDDLIAQHSASGYAIRNFADNHNFGHHEQSRYPAKR
jgi:hypothetical protein